MGSIACLMVSFWGVNVLESVVMVAHLREYTEVTAGHPIE